MLIFHRHSTVDPNQQNDILIGQVKHNVRENIFFVFQLTNQKNYFRYLGPVEYFRGKRFWLFTKKDDTSSQQDSVSSNTLGQGIWRSGIVGKR